tara:strand:+ start:1495 stop:2277 length:783 start_codon:yes stop_codon:yes gene_type:complete
VLLNAVIIILREVIEASLIISLFLAYSQIFKHDRTWLLKALIFGLISAVVYAINIGVVSLWFEGVGQEIINAGIQTIIYLVLLIFLIAVMRPRTALNKSILTAMMMTGVIFAAVREGSEIILYIHGFVTVPELLQSVLLGSAIGGGIGVSIGVCIYYLLINMPVKISVSVAYMLIVLVAGSMVSQTIQQLTQADWISSQYPLWDTSSLISEHSVTGQLLYAVIGYEATPTAIQVTAYLSSLIIIILLSGYSWHYYRKFQK